MRDYLGAVLILFLLRLLCSVNLHLNICAVMICFQFLGQYFPPQTVSVHYRSPPILPLPKLLFLISLQPGIYLFIIVQLQVLSQNENPFLYSLVFGEGVVNDATSVVLFNAIQKIDVSKLNGSTVLHVFQDFLYLFSTSTALGIVVSSILYAFHKNRASSVKLLLQLLN